jgi:putative ABC transport system permease protein
VVAAGPADIPLISDAQIDGAVLAFTMVATLLTVALVGLVPAWRSGRPELTMVLRQAGTRSRGRDDRRLMGMLTASQIAIAMVLLTAGGLMARSFQALLRVNPGLDTERVLTFQLEVPMGAGMPYASQSARDVFFATLLEHIESLPGIGAATMASAPPLEEEPSTLSFTRPGVADGRTLGATFRMVAPKYFSVLRIPIVNGRAFEARDNRSGPSVAIVSEALAKSVWGGESPVGARISLRSGEQAEVVGVAGDVRTTGLDGDVGRTVYIPASQGGYNFMTVIARSRNDPRALAPTMRKLVRELDPNVPLHHVRTLDELAASSVAQQRFQTLLVGAFSVLVFVLAVIGTYGVASYGVSERTGELGIRMALGATAGDVRQLVLKEGGRLALAGIVIGAILAVASSQMLARFVFQISPLDVVTFTIAPILLASAALLATLIPAQRAARVDPMRTLRAD